MEFTPVWLPKSLSVQLWSLRLCGYRCVCPYNYGVYAGVATDVFVRTTMEFTPVWLPMSLSVQLWSCTDKLIGSHTGVNSIVVRTNSLAVATQA